MVTPFRLSLTRVHPESQVLNRLLPQLFALLFAYVILIASYTTLAVPFFEDLRVDGFILSNETNFQGFYKALTAVHEMANGDYWVEIFSSAQREPPFCDPGVDCPGRAAYLIVPIPAVLSFLLFSVLTSALFDFIAYLNLDSNSVHGLNIEVCVWASVYADVYVHVYVHALVHVFVCVFVCVCVCQGEVRILSTALHLHCPVLHIALFPTNRKTSRAARQLLRLSCFVLICGSHCVCVCVF